MRGFRDRRIVLLVIALFISALFIMAPWKPADSQPEGAPLGEYVRGPNWGIDITGGSRIMLQLQAREARVRFDSPLQDSAEAGRFISRLENKLRLEIRLLMTDNNLSGSEELNLLIMESITENAFASALGDNVSLLGDSFKFADFSASRQKSRIREQLMDDLSDRVDPQGTLGAQFKPIGSRFIMYEVSLTDPAEARKLLGHTGRLEIFVDNTLVLWDKHIGDTGTIRKEPGQGIVLPFNLADNGPERWEDLTEGKAGEPGVIYLDRPGSSIVLLPSTLMPELDESYLSYNSDLRKFKVTFETARGEREFYLQVPVVRVDMNSDSPISSDSRDFLKKNSGRYSRVIWLGGKADFPSSLRKGDSLVLDNTTEFNIDYISRQVDDREESIFSWVAERVCGYRSSPTLDENVAGQKLDSLSITGLGSQDEARDLKTILSRSLPIEIKPVSSERVDRRLSGNFMEEALFAGLAAFAVVGTLVFAFYKRFKIVVPLLLTMISEVVITLGAASIASPFMSIGLPGIGGLIAVVGTGVDHQIIIADEVLAEKTSEQGKLPIDRRTGRAFAVIFSAAATTVAAMVALAIFGFGPMRGFALVTLFGVLVSVLITRPAFARIVGVLLEREENE